MTVICDPEKITQSQCFLKKGFFGLVRSLVSTTDN